MSNFRASYGLMMFTALALSACGGGGGTADSVAPNLNPTQTNFAPLITGSLDATAMVGESYKFTPSASDPDGDALSFSVLNQPAWMAFSNQTGELTGTPQPGDEGTYGNIVVGVSDGKNSVELPAATVLVEANNAPQFTNAPNLAATVGVNYGFVPTVVDPDSADLEFSVENLPGWARFDAPEGAIRGVPSTDDIGSHRNVSISVTDGMSTATLGPFTIVVSSSSGNLPPEISGVPALTVVAGNAYSFTPDAFDPEGSPLLFGLQNRPLWASFDSATGALTGTPGAAQIGVYSNIIISVTDSVNAVSLVAFDITVLPGLPLINTAPTISGAPGGSVIVGMTYEFTPQAADADGDALGFAIQNRPAWALFSTTNGRLFGVPTADDIGDYAAIRISVSDGSETTSLPAFAISVSATNTAPVISGSPNLSIESGGDYSFVPTASDADGDTLSFTVVNLPIWATFNNITGELSGAPSASDADPGTYSGIVITVSDGTETAALNAFTITVTSANSAPQISGSPGTMVTVGSAYTFTPSASDADGDDLTFSVVNKPTWVAFDSATGRLSGTPDSSEVGTYSNITISVTDGENTASLAAFTIEVADVVLGSITLNWTPPTEYEDGTTLNDLSGYRVNYGTLPGDYTSVEEVNVGGISTYVIQNLAPDTYYIALTVVNSTGVTSAFSEEVTVVVTGN